MSEVPPPRNEPVRTYAPGSAERKSLEARLGELADASVDLTMTIGGVARSGSGTPVDVVMPHRRRSVLGRFWEATTAEVTAAVDAALAAAPAWREMRFADRASIFLKAAELLAGPWRDTVNAATMLGQSKTVHQAEIDAVCELADFWRFNVAFAKRIYAEQPASPPGVWNRTDHRPLEGFVLAITPFNFTSITGNLPTAPAIMGNTVVWKPAHSAGLAAHFIMAVLEAAGLPRGVINLVTGSGRAVSEVALARPELAGIHFTGSTGVFHELWRAVGANIDRYANYPRVVGETGGKDFVLAHPSADVDALRVALVRGAFEYQGQKCSAASRAYLPASLWRELRDPLAAEVDGISVGDISDFSVFMGAVIDDRAYDRLSSVVSEWRTDPTVSLLAGGRCDDREGWFVWPTVAVGTDPGHQMFSTEYFGPLLSVYVWDDSAPTSWTDVLALVDRTSPYGLTGAIFARDRVALRSAADALRYAAGNLYFNDKPTGAVVGQQPFGGARASGTDDKAGSAANLMRWVAPRVIKETFVAPTDYRYPHMG